MNIVHFHRHYRAVGHCLKAFFLISTMLADDVFLGKIPEV